MAKGARTQGPGGRGAPSQALSCSRGGGRGQGPGARTAWVPLGVGAPTCSKGQCSCRDPSRPGQAGQQRRQARRGRDVAACQPRSLCASPAGLLVCQFAAYAPPVPSAAAQHLGARPACPQGMDEGRECHPTCQQGQVTPEWLCPLGGGLGSPLVTQARRREAGPREHRLLPQGRPLRPWPILQLASFSSSIFNSPPACRFGLAAVADALPGRQNGFVSSLG